MFHKIRTLYDKLLWRKLTKINDCELLWRAVFKTEQIKDNGVLKSSFFMNSDGVSCDLAKYTTVVESRRGIVNPPWPDHTGLVEFSAGLVRTHKSDIKHDPLKANKEKNTRKNYAHCQFTAPLTRSQARKLVKIVSFKVRPDVKKIYE